MRAIRLPTGSPLAPFGDAPGEVLVANEPLAAAQDRALRTAGLEPAEAPDPHAPYLVYSDRCWFTSRLVASLAAAGRPGRLLLQDPNLVRDAGVFQPDPARPELAVRPPGAPVSLEGDDLPVDLTFHSVPLTDPHPAYAHAQRGPFVIGSRLAHSIVHWSDLLRANLLALAAKAEEAREDWEQGGLWARLGLIGGVLWRAKGLSRVALARGLGHEGKGCKIHPTAIVEACELGDGVEVGPFCILRGCMLGDGVKVDPYVTVGLSVVGAGARLGRGLMLNLSVVYPGAFVSEGGGYQMCVIGRDAFLAKTAVALDLSFGRSIRTVHAGVSVDTESYFLGAAVGHRAKIGAGVRLAYGVAVPNDALLVAPPDTLFRRFPEQATEPLTVVDGVAVPVAPRRRDASAPPLRDGEAPSSPPPAHRIG